MTCKSTLITVNLDNPDGFGQNEVFASKCRAWKFPDILTISILAVYAIKVDLGYRNITY